MHSMRIDSWLDGTVIGNILSSKPRRLAVSVRSLSDGFALKQIFLSFFLALVLFGVPQHLSAQATGRVGGTVTDQTEATVPDVNVVITNLDTGIARSASTNAAGIFEFPDLPIGQYRVDLTKSGFQS